MRGWRVSWSRNEANDSDSCKGRARYVLPQLLQREQSHRRVVLIGIASVIALSTTPVFGHHLESQGHMLLAGRDHLGPLCLIALHYLLAPVHQAFHVALFFGLAYAAWDRGRAWREVRRTLRALDGSVPSTKDPLGVAARRAGLEVSRIRVVPGLPNPAFTAGFWRPLVYVSASLSETLDSAQLESVLAHEALHVRRRDPLRLTLLRTFACMLFYVPALRRLADDLADEAEIDADDAAAAHGSPLVLASAILALAEWSAPKQSFHRMLPTLPAATATGFQPAEGRGRVDLLDRRIRRLAGEPARVESHVTRRSLAGAAAVLLAVWISGIMMAHPLPAATVGGALHSGRQAAHCEHVQGFALGHLLCLGFHSRPVGAPCPHSVR